MELRPSALPSLCQPGRYQIGGTYPADAILVETRYDPDGARVDLSYTMDQLRVILAPHVPDGYVDGDPILNAVWEAVKEANPEDEILCRFCDGMIRAGRGESWAPTTIRPDNTI